MGTNLVPESPFFDNKKDRIVGYVQLVGVILFIAAVYWIAVTYGT